MNVVKLNNYIETNIKGEQKKWIYFNKNDGIVSNDHNTISYYVAFNDYKKGNTPLGIVVINVKDNIFSDLLNSKNLNNLGYYEVIDDKSSIVYSYNPQDYNINIEGINLNSFRNDYSVTKIHNTDYAIFYEPIGDTKWKIITLMPVSVYLRDINFIRKIILFTGLFCFLLAVYLNVRFSKNISRPVNELIHNMKMVKNGNLSVQSKINSDDEFGEIQKMFNKMVGKINDLINEVYTKEKQKRMAELNALQAQINPHFFI